MISTMQAAALNNKGLHLIILPTERCNFRCVYCYEDFTLGRMSKGTVEGIRNLISLRAPGLTALDISWFGGEPLLAYDIVEEIQGHAHNIAGRFSLHLNATMTTNASLLTAERHSYLSNRGLKVFQISLDGDRLDHDSTRVSASGMGTFDKIWGNLKSIRDGSQGVGTCLLRIHLTRNNIRGIERLVEPLVTEFASDTRFQLYFRKIDDFGGPGGLSAADLELLEFERTKSNLIASLPANMRWNEHSDEASVCYAARANSWLIRSDGRLGKCTVAFHSPRNTVGRISADGSLHVDQEAWRPWIEPVLNNDAAGMECPLHYSPPIRTHIHPSRQLKMLG